GLHDRDRRRPPGGRRRHGPGGIGSCGRGLVLAAAGPALLRGGCHHAAPSSSVSRYAPRPTTPPSRPKPDSLDPPNAAVGSNRLNVFAHTTPARIAAAMPRIRDPFSVQIPADNPYGVLFALATASSGVRNVSTDNTGPKISSRAIRIDC